MGCWRGGKKGWQVNYTNAGENSESGVMLERKEEHVLERDCVKVWRAIGHTVQLSCDI